ncbi:HlyD family efflux transporter periplasmic adaptor subunit [Romeria aff. gracilis LEGE 07310]|uniref:HlyD family efflux transporter periplasmic adaptor subunit n=1 Tax=Vasconcelosia minhoensis LEGE 07310 TaxID=915328 RepID=A0A8J7AWM4_9CYAN|nr:HlyD family efflux transporter periplasmic adaptor subunit [Romeria gracilis]MBE9078603.1 HlyD family efflux transporter periplasmic adaptor subunit [Romeria aff. gracilis LEGE 07310]
MKLEYKQQPLPHEEEGTEFETRQFIFRAIRLVFGLGLIAIIGYLLWDNYRKTTSSQAYINGIIIPVRAPITGTFKISNQDLELTPGKSIQAGTTIGRIENIRADPQLATTQQQLRSQVQQTEKQLENIQIKIENRQQSLQKVAHKSNQENALQVESAQAQVNRRFNQLQQAQKTAEFTQREAQRYRQLGAAGAVSRNRVEEEDTEAQIAQEIVDASQAQLAQARADLAAAKAGLSLEGGNSFSYPQVRRQELQTEIADLQLQLKALKTQQEQQKSELGTADQQFQLQTRAAVKMPTTGVVWSVENPPSSQGTTLSAGDTIFRVVQCSETWVEAFFPENEIEELSIGTPAQIKLLAGNSTFSGSVQRIRAGVGRVSPGQESAVPPPDQVRREVAVRLSIDNPIKAPAEFCGIGRSVEVTFSEGQGLFF